MVNYDNFRRMHLILIPSCLNSSRLISKLFTDTNTDTCRLLLRTHTETPAVQTTQQTAGQKTALHCFG